MSATVKIINHLEVTLGDDLKEVGSREVAQEITIAGECYEVQVVVADDYGRQVIWQNGDAGIDDFDVLTVESDVDVLLELTIDRAGTPSYTVLEVYAGVPFILASDDMLNAVLDGTVATMDQIDQIAVQNNVADAAGDATVKLMLLT